MFASFVSRSPPAQEAPTELVVTAELIRTVLSGLATNAGLAIPAACAMALLPQLSPAPAQVSIASIVWLVVVTAMMLGGVRAGRAAKRHLSNTQYLLSQENALTRRAAMASLVWGSTSWVLLPANSVEGEAFIVMGIAMVLMGGAGGHAAHRRTVLTYAVPLGVIFAAGLIRFGDLLHVSLGIGFLVFAAVALLFALNQGEAVRKQIAATLESESLRAIADSASRTKTEFLAAASHDLRQPLHALTMFLGTLTFHVTTDEAKRLLGRIQETVRVLEEQFDSLLDLSRFDAGAVAADIQPFRLDRCIERLIDETRPIAEARNLQITLNACPATVASDAMLVSRLLRNLLDNAVKYTSHGSISISVTQHPDGYAVEVADTGSGIAADQQASIFDEYVQLGNPARQRERGVGLGLAIVKRIDRLLGLRLTVRSEVGAGSSFSFVAPAADSHAEESVPDTRAAAAAASFRTSASIWLLDDDPAALESLQGQLQAWGAEVSAFATPGELLSQLRTQARGPDWIFTDDMLGDSLSGLDVARIVSQEFPLTHVCVITGNIERKRQAELRSDGFPIIVKPAKPEQLVLLIGGAPEPGSSAKAHPIL
jgi:two-component system, sensor histidine kinase